MRVKRSEYGQAPECKGGGNGRPPSNPADQWYRLALFPRAKIRTTGGGGGGGGPTGNRTLFALMEGTLQGFSDDAGKLFQLALGVEECSSRIFCKCEKVGGGTGGRVIAGLIARALSCYFLPSRLLAPEEGLVASAAPRLETPSVRRRSTTNSLSNQDLWNVPPVFKNQPSLRGNGVKWRMLCARKLPFSDDSAALRHLSETPELLTFRVGRSVMHEGRVLSVLRRFDYLPPTTANRGRFPAGSSHGLRMWTSCQTMLPFGGFPRGVSRFPRRCIPALLHTHLTSASSSLMTSIYVHVKSEPKAYLPRHKHRIPSNLFRGKTGYTLGHQPIKRITAKEDSGLLEMRFFRKSHTQEDPAPKEIGDIDPRDIIADDVCPRPGKARGGISFPKLVPRAVEEHSILHVRKMPVGREGWADRIDVKHVYAEDDFAIASQFIRHALDVSNQIADSELSVEQRWNVLAWWGRGVSEKALRPAESSGTIPTCENPEASPPKNRTRLDLVGGGLSIPIPPQLLINTSTSDPTSEQTWVARAEDLPPLSRGLQKPRERGGESRRDPPSPDRIMSRYGWRASAGDIYIDRKRE
ncbi:hypothetical protein PR048_033407 [Dryococelus australis]|uniref:Uncharacterized protein n=1 Tax=Dryococelus australis TaxID=614101 RepID=A0ABQ9G067_9NEOP|nr:hypothetical protein PR048_033407 [Dryococelus australis]